MPNYAHLSADRYITIDIILHEPSILFAVSAATEGRKRGGDGIGRGKAESDKDDKTVTHIS